MCGIFGYVATQNLLTRPRIIHARDQMYTRGPDDAGDCLLHSSTPQQYNPSHSPAHTQHYVHDACHRPVWTALAHRRLSIMDLSTAGHQPFQSVCGRYHLVYNGELYYLDRLRQHLLQRGIQLRTRCDTEILLHLLILYQENVFALLNGMFAFAFWDQQQQKLLLARDPMGIKPLYYSVQSFSSSSQASADEMSQPPPILFASQVQSLLATGIIDDQLDLQAHLDYLSLTYTPSPQTSIKAIKQLAPAHYLSWHVHTGIQTQAYQSNPVHAYPYDASWANWAKQLRHRLCAAVAVRLVSDVPVGIFLSGGVDSSALVYAAHQVSTQPLHTFTIKFAEQSFDESPYASSVAQAFGCIHHETLVHPDPDEFMTPLMQALDQPFADSSAIPLWYLCRSAREHVTVALGGDGGDELLAGYRTHQAAMLAQYYRRLPQSWQKKVTNWIRRLPVSHRKVSWDLKLKQFTQAMDVSAVHSYAHFKNFLPHPLKTQLCQPLYHKLYHTKLDAHSSESFPKHIDEILAWEVNESSLNSQDAQYQDLLIRHFQPYFNHSTHFLHQQEATPSPISSADLNNLSHYLQCDQGLYLPDNILTKADRVSMGHALELRVPFLDPHLRGWINHLPNSYKWSFYENKRILKYALKGRVPAHVLKRSKAGFNVPMAQWLLGALKPLCDDLFSHDSIEQVGLWSPKWVDYMRQEHQQQRQDFSRPLWAMLCFMMFYQRCKSVKRL